ncbi:MAG: hypothetical protein P8127_12400 [Acidobacteriota bacterium]
MEKENLHPVVGWLWKIPAIALAYFIGVVISGAVITATNLRWPSFPESFNQSNEFVLSLVGAVLMAFCMALLARGVGGSYVARWFMLATFSYVAFGLNNQIEAAIFTTYGGTVTMLLFLILPCALGAAAAVSLFEPEWMETVLENTITSQPLSKWFWRVAVAWLAFPVIYLFFGMLAAPIVVPVYQSQNFGLTLPGFATIIPVALVRSALYLAVTIPIIVSWSRSRRSLFWSLAITLFAMMGLIGLLSTTFFPPVLRITHSVEILGDAFVYAWLLVALFVPNARHEVNESVPAVADS